MSIHKAQPNELYFKGIDIGEVGWANAVVSKGIVARECLEKGGWKFSDHQLTKVPDEFWRTLAADRTVEGEDLRPWYHRAALHCMSRVDNFGNLRVWELLEPGLSVEGTLPSIVFDYLKRVEGVIWKRRFIEDDSETHDSEPLFGLSPASTQPGDRICSLYGCSFPVILRPANPKDDSQHRKYYFTGEAYIYGKMDGEAISMLSEEGLVTNTVEFVIV